MSSKPARGATGESEPATLVPDPAQYVLRLYVAGLTPRSLAAIKNARRICEEFLKDRYDLAVIDLSKHPALAAAEQIVVAPTLIKELPKPLRRLVGDLSDRERVLHGLDLPTKREDA
jgi:circadian clock protein KaiB